MPFTNRCRSPSPGLFQDIDMFNFSSDTLFGINTLEDQKSDPSEFSFFLFKKSISFFFQIIIGFFQKALGLNNPDLFQPDLMHLYPNFDFFDLDYSKYL